jgi:hypothetical protein
MTVSYVTSLKTTRMVAVINAIDANASPGFIEIGNTGMAAVLCTITLQKPSFSESSGVITMLGTPISANGSLAGTAAAARIKDGGGNIVATGLTVGATSGFDIVLSSTAVSVGQPVTLNSMTITHSP